MTPSLRKEGSSKYAGREVPLHESICNDGPYGVKIGKLRPRQSFTEIEDEK
jgi:hypothetical protein